MVGQFMDGIDRDYLDFTMKFVQTALLELYPALISELLGNKLAPPQISRIQGKFNEAGESILSILGQEMQKYSRMYHSAPIVDIVHALPKEELAAMAEALVNLTSFKRHITQDAETVGGPIDVAVMSRGDGFIWIKRKHYFSKDLNPQFLANYYKDAERN